MAIDENRLNKFMGRAVGDIGAVVSAALVTVGDQPGLYKELARAAATPAELARRTGRALRARMAQQPAPVNNVHWPSRNK